VLISLLEPLKEKILKKLKKKLIKMNDIICLYIDMFDACLYIYTSVGLLSIQLLGLLDNINIIRLQQCN
jgi:hypothetical protein